MNKRVCVIIPNYNGMKFLPACIRALEKQSYQNFDTVIIDNGSADSSVGWLRQWKSEKEDRILIENSQNRGFAAAVNQGIEEALKNGSEYTVLLNNDTEPKPDFLYELVRMMDRNRKKNVFALSAKMLEMSDPSRMDDAGDEYLFLGWQVQRGHDEPAEKWNRPEPVFSACAGAALYRTELFRKIGLFDERHFAYLEDIDLSFRANLYGYRIYYAPKAECLHYGSGTSGSRYNTFKVRVSARNSIYVVVKNIRGVLLLVNLPYLLAGFLIKLLCFTAMGFGGSYLAGLAEGLGSVGSLKKADYSKSSFKSRLRIEAMMLSAAVGYLKRMLRRYSR